METEKDSGKAFKDKHGGWDAPLHRLGRSARIRYATVTSLSRACLTEKLRGKMKGVLSGMPLFTPDAVAE